MSTMLRSLAGAALVALSIGLVIWGGATPAAQSRASGTRPLTLPVVQGDATCPVSQGSLDVVPRAVHVFGSGGVWFGEGPVYVNFAWKSDRQPPARFRVASMPFFGEGVRRAKTPWVAEPAFVGPIVVRGRSVHPDAQPLRFSSGSDEIGEVLRIQAPLDRPSSADWGFQASSLYIPGPGCYALQIDTPQKTSIVIFEALP